MINKVKEGERKMFNEKLQKYADLIVKMGANVQKNQIVVIKTIVEGVDFARALTKAAYETGARHVYVQLSDEEISRLTYEYETEEALAEFPEWETQKYDKWVEQDAVFISISAANPDLLKGIPASKIATYQKAAGRGLAKFRKATGSSEVAWCIASIPTEKWSLKVFPEAKDAEEAKNLLWEKIFEVNRINEADPVAAWQKHIDNLTRRCKYLNDKNIKSLHYVAPGTDLHVDLPEGHIWEGGGEYSTKGIYFVANMPTEEIFTMPAKYGVNGTLKATKPLVYSGNLIKDFSFVFKDGKVVAFEAAEGKEVLDKLIHTDEGASYLGEVAIVPHSSPISQTNVLFYNTLFDENASCHFAVGSSYPTTLKDGVKMTEEELEAHGANTSITHNDFMVGSNALNIEATTHTGEKFYVLKDGEWTF